VVADVDEAAAVLPELLPPELPPICAEEAVVELELLPQPVIATAIAAIAAIAVIDMNCLHLI